MPVTQDDLLEAIAVSRDGDGLTASLPDGWGVYGIPHGGVLAALIGNAALTASDEADLFTLTVHYLRKAETGELQLTADPVGGSRRFTSWRVTASQHGAPVVTALVSVGDRTTLEGPSWTDRPAWTAPEEALTPPAGDPAQEEVFATPEIAQRFGQRLVADTVAFANGRRAEDAVLRSRIAIDHPDQLTALVACDITPPAVWNVLGPQGWVPTVELTAHVRARPTAGPLSVEASTHHVGGGFLEEDAVVHDASGQLVVQSRQLARTPQGR